VASARYGGLLSLLAGAPQRTAPCRSAAHWVPWRPSFGCCRVLQGGATIAGYRISPVRLGDG
jgi:hypothetical protein